MGVKAQINPVSKCSSVSHSNRWQSCLPNPCSNNGTCEPLVSGGYKCNCPADNPDQFGPNCQILAATYNGQGKVLSLLEACFDLISSPSLSMKIQIMGRKITKNWVQISTPEGQTFFYSFFLSIFKLFTQNWVSLILTTF